MNFRASDKLWQGGSYTYLHTEDKETNQELQYRPKPKIALDGRYKFPYDIYTSIQASYTTGAQELNDDNAMQEAQGFFLLNARVDKSFGSIIGMKNFCNLIDFFKLCYSANTPVHLAYRAGYSGGEKVIRTDVKGLQETVEREEEKNLFLIYVGPCLETKKAFRTS